jgi:hypothetical protein
VLDIMATRLLRGGRTRLLLAGLVALVGWRRMGNRQTHGERVVFLILGILGNFTIGLTEALGRRLARGHAAHEQWSLARELVYGACRRVLTYAGHLFEQDPKSYAAWTSISEAMAYVPAKHMLPTLGLGSLHFDGGQGSLSGTVVPCAAVFLAENAERVRDQLLRSKPDPTLIYIVHAHGGGYVAGVRMKCFCGVFPIETTY